METNSVSRRYETRRSTRTKELVAKSRVDWSRTKRTKLFDSEEEDDEITSGSEKESQTSSEDEEEEKDGSVVNGSKEETTVNASSLPVIKAGCDGTAEEDAEEESIVPGKLKRSRSSVMYGDSDESEVEEKGESMVNGSKEETTVNESSFPVIKAGCDGAAEEDAEEESIVPGKLKRSRSSVMYDDSDGSDDSGIVRKVFAKRSCIIDEEDSSAEQEQHASPAEEKTKRKQKRLMKLQELSQRRSTQARSDSNCHEDAEDDAFILEDTCSSSFNLADISDSADDDSMKDFIVEEEDEGKELKQEESEDDELQEKKHATSRRTLLERYVPNLVGHLSLCDHLKRIVRAFLINAVDCTFLISLYEGERQKRYAQEMLASLRYLDDRIIQPRLDNLLSRSRWKERYKERVDSYPNVCMVFGSAEQRSCQACELQRYCKLTVVLSGKLYNTRTMEIDDFMSYDKQRLKVGIVCGNRTKVYHKLKHFKYKLYQDCCYVMKQDEFQDEPLKERVGKVFSQLEGDGWLQKHYRDLEDCTNEADYFQEEKMD